MRPDNAVRQLNLAGNRIGNFGVEALCDALAQRHCHLVSLNVSGNYLREEAASSMAQALR